MGIKLTHRMPPEYYALKARSETLASWWQVGHAWFVVFLAMGLVSPVFLAIATYFINSGLIDWDETKGPPWETALSILIACLLLSACGYTLRWYAGKKGSRD